LAQASSFIPLLIPKPLFQMVHRLQPFHVVVWALLLRVCAWGKLSCQADARPSTHCIAPWVIDELGETLSSDSDASVFLFHTEAHVFRANASKTFAQWDIWSALHLPRIPWHYDSYNETQMLSPADALRLYQMTHAFTLILGRHNITYWAGGGTLLGAVRNKGIISHDNDIDLHILAEDLPRFDTAELRADLLLNGMEIRAFEYREHWWPWSKRAMPHGWQWHITDKDARSWREPRYLIDVFVLETVGDRLEVKDKGTYGDRAFPSNVVEHLQPWPFGSSTVMAPSRAIAESYLSKVFGPNWQSEVNCGHTLHPCKLDKDATWDLRGMAMPCGPLQRLITADSIDPDSHEVPQ